MTIDLFIIRKLGLALRGVPQIATDVVGLVDEWAARFFEELDYQREGRNGTLFAQQMAADLPQVSHPIRAREAHLSAVQLPCSISVTCVISSRSRSCFVLSLNRMVLAMSSLHNWQCCQPNSCACLLPYVTLRRCALSYMTG